MINYKQAREAVKLAIKGNNVPVIVGEAGIGKTAMMRSIAEELDMKLFIIEGNIIKSGEATGLPITSEDKNKRMERELRERGITLKQYTTEEVLEMNEEYQELLIEKEFLIATKDKEGIKDLSKQLAKHVKDAVKKKDALNKKALEKYENEKKEIGRYLPEITTEYATFGTLARTNEWLAKSENKDKEALLFIDEINRSSIEVLQELMNLILNRSINGFELDPRIKIVGAANPSSRWNEFKDADYQVIDPDPAQEDRLCWLFVESDVQSWMDWAADFNEDTGVSNIHEDIIEFIATYPDMLHIPLYKSSDDIVPSPRSYERVSKNYINFMNDKSIGKGAFEALVYGDLGPTTGLALIRHLNDKDNPLLKAEEIFKSTKTDKLPKDIADRYEKEAPIRKIAILKNCMKYMTVKKKLTNEPALFINLINLTKADVRVGIMSDICNNYTKLHKKLVEFDEYIDAFHELNVLI
jgi:MoxR-like ATPase